MFHEALIFAYEKHQGQFRKGNGMPYITHPISVVETLRKFKKSSNEDLLMTCCILHDTIEDCDVTIQEIANKFGYMVASIVQELTSDDVELAKVGKTQYLIKKMLKMSSYALVIKLCDRLDNTKDLKDLSIDKAKSYALQTREILDALKQRKLSNTHINLIKAIENNIKSFLN